MLGLLKIATLSLIGFLLGCSPNHSPKLWCWPTGPTVPCGIHLVTLPSSVIRYTNTGVAYIDTVVKDRILNAIQVQIQAFEQDESMTLPQTHLGVTDLQSIPWCGAQVGGGWEAIDNPKFWNYALNTIGDNQNVWPVYHELHHIIFGDPNHTSPKWAIWNAKTNQLAAINAARPYPPGVDPKNP